MFRLLPGVSPYKNEDVDRYFQRGWWRSLTIGDLLDRAAEIHPDKEAFVDQTSRYTYSQAREKVDRLAIGLLHLGIGALDRVLIQLPNWNEFVFAYFACQKVGAIPVLLIERHRPYEIGRLIGLSGASAWIAPRQTDKVDFGPIIQDVRKANPHLKTIITVRGKLDQAATSSLEELIEDSVLTNANRQRLTNLRADPRQVAHMGPTGGTTGDPKLVPRTHSSLICAVEYCSMSWNQHCEDINMIAGPIGHDLSFTKGLLGSILTQGTLVFQESKDATSIHKTIEREEVTSIILVPTIAQRLVRCEDADQFNTRSLKKMHIAGGAGHPDMVRELLNRFSMTMYSGYGGTEGMTTITRKTDDFESICGTVGRPTCPHDQYKVVGENGKALPPNTTGELLVKGPSMFSGYYNDPETNTQAFDRDGFFITGDMAKISEDGYITLVERRKHMIKRGGESISASDIENLIILHPEVAAVAVVPMPDPIMGERACAYIETKPNATLTFDDVIAFLRDRNVAVLQFPERVELVDRMPLTLAEKVDKLALRRDIENKLRDNFNARTHGSTAMD
jgi:2,3-dihydroxybenzoate-AMP ligase/mycobactin salicyl-AMP ligase